MSFNAPSNPTHPIILLLLLIKIEAVKGPKLGIFLSQNGFLVVLCSGESNEEFSVRGIGRGRYSIITSHKKLLLCFSMCFVSYWVNNSNLNYFEEYVSFVSVSKYVCMCVCVGTKELLLKYCKRSWCCWAEEL